MKGQRTESKRRRGCLRSGDEKGVQISKRREVSKCELQLLRERVKKLQLGIRGK
jgi:hypothetical protein